MSGLEIALVTIGGVVVASILCWILVAFAQRVARRNGKSVAKPHSNGQSRAHGADGS